MLTIRKGSEILSFKSWLFPGGETGVRLDTDNLRYRHCDDPIGQIVNAKPPTHQTIWARLQSAADIMELVMVTDALRRWDDTPLHLVLPSVPYARQDRVGVQGESHSLKAFAALINGLGFERVTVFDPHSDVTGAVFDRVQLIDQITILGRFAPLNGRLIPATPDERPVLVSPDKGAAKKVEALAAHYGLPVIYGDKKRDLATGKLTGFKAHAEDVDVTGRDLVILDDLLDGGGTFVGLAAELRKLKPRRVELYVTHCIASKGFNPLFDGGIDRLWTTNAFGLPRHPITDHNDLITVLNLEEAFTL